MELSGPHSAKVAVPCPDKTLFEQDQKVNGLMQQISSYTSITQSANDYEQIKNHEKKAAGMGTLMGVYFPTIQNIFGVILFIRMPWIVGLAGISGAFGLVAFCCLTTLLTAISMSAIATNGRVPAGGSYYMISRSLGPGWGGAVGIMFYLGTTVASAMYIVGAAEIMTLYLGVGRLWDLDEGSGLFSGEYNNYRIIGLMMLTVMCSIVFVGVKWVNMSAVPFLGVVIVSILFMFVGFFVSAAGPNPTTVVCMMGDVLVKRPADGLCNKFLEDMKQFETTLPYTINNTTCPADGDFCTLLVDDTVYKSNKYSTKCKLLDSEGEVFGNKTTNWDNHTCKTPTELFKSFCNGTSFDIAAFDPTSQYSGCEYEAFLGMPEWSRHGVPGLGYSSESWNVKAHHYVNVNDPITIPEILDPLLANATNNMMVCEKSTWKEFPKRTASPWQWECDTDMWVQADKSSILSQIVTHTEMASCPEEGADVLKARSPLPSIGDQTRDKLPYVTSDYVGSNVQSSFMILIGVFFPSVTGIMAGSNRSGDLANGQKSIPIGTICAILTTTVAYLASVVLAGFACDGALMRDKFGDSLSTGDGLQILMNASITWPHPLVMLIGALLSSIGAGLQSLTGAPRLLQSIASDDVIPKFGVFARGRGKGNEPTWAILLTYIISAVFIVIAKIETITPFITIFFLMCYLFVNVSTTLSSLIHAPSWRPSFKYYHWSLSLIGSLCCIFLIFIVDYISAIFIGIMAAGLYTMINVFGAKKEWGDSVKGLHMSMAINSLKTLNLNQCAHTKNWRPQVLLLNKLKGDGSSVIKYPKLLDFCHSLKEGKGLLIIKTLIQGEYEEYADQKETVQEAINEEIRKKNISAIETGITISPDIARDVPLVVQTVGLSGLKPNCIVLNFPTVSADRVDYSFFYNVARHAAATDCALIVTKNIDQFPEHNEFETESIDVWWIRLDGGMTLLLSHLIKRTPTWKRCKLRIFVTAEEGDNSEAMRESLDTYLRDMRIFAQVIIVEMDSEDTLPYSQNISAKLEATKKSREHVRDVDVVMNKARQSCAAPSTKMHTDAERIPKSFSGTWSNNRTGPRSTVIKKMHQANGLNKKITEMSGDASLVFLNMPPFPLEHNVEREANYMKYIESITKNLKRLVLVRTTGNEVITAFN